MPQRITCIISAYNEASRIGNVLKAIVGHPLLREVIVVDDGSTDGTSAAVRAFPKVKLIAYEHNRGKSSALVRGVQAASGDFIMTLDADLQNLSSADITKLAAPVLSGAADVSISVRKNSLAIYRAIGLDFVSGERVIPSSLITDYAKEIEALPSYGIESFINKRIIEKRLRIAIVRLTDVINTRKSEKAGRIRGTLMEWKMVFDILRVLTPYEVARQNYWMLRLARAGTRHDSKA